MNSRNKKITLLSVLVVVLILGAGVTMILFRNNTQPVPSTAKAKITKSMFEFMGADGWRKGPSNETSMALFNSQDPSREAPCFTSIEYYAGTVDASAELNASRQSLSDSGYTVAPLGVKTLTIQTPNGAKQYVMNLSNTTPREGSEKIMSGHAIGYLQLSDGYLKVYGNCNASTELPEVFPALEAVKIVANSPE